MPELFALHGPTAKVAAGMGESTLPCKGSSIDPPGGPRRGQSRAKPQATKAMRAERGRRR